MRDIIMACGEATTISHQDTTEYFLLVNLTNGNVLMLDVCLPEWSVVVCAYLIIEVEERVELVIVENIVQEVRVLVAGLGQAVDVVKTVEHQTHRGVGYFVLSHLIAITTGH